MEGQKRAGGVYGDLFILLSQDRWVRLTGLGGRSKDGDSWPLVAGVRLQKKALL